MIRHHLAATLALVLLAGLSLVAGDAFAQRGPGAGPGGGMGRGTFATVDANGDGVISRDEFKSHVESMFAVMDRNGRGWITKEEFLSLRMGPGGGFGSGYQGIQRHKAARFAHMDADHGGTVDKVEFMAWEMARFDKADSGHKGVLTPQHFRAFDRW